MWGATATAAVNQVRLGGQRAHTVPHAGRRTQNMQVWPNHCQKTAQLPPEHTCGEGAGLYVHDAQAAHHVAIAGHLKPHKEVSTDEKLKRLLDLRTA